MQFDWDGKILSKLRELCEKKTLVVLTTSITQREIRNQLEEKLDPIVSWLKKHRSQLSQLGFTVPAAALDKEIGLATLADRFASYFAAIAVQDVKINADPLDVFADYFNNSPPFGTAGKKSEFPDAFVITSLRNWCVANGNTAYVVSADTDISSCCSGDGPLVHLTSISQLISIATTHEELREKIHAALESSETLVEIIKNKLSSPRVFGTSIEVNFSRVTNIEIRGVNVVDVAPNRRFSVDAQISAEIALNYSIEPPSWSFHADPNDERYGPITEEVDDIVSFEAEVEIELNPDEQNSLNILDVEIPDPIEMLLGLWGSRRPVFLVVS